MARLVMDDKLVRALSALGGRNLTKATEILAANIAKLMDGKIESNGLKVVLMTPKRQIILKPKPQKSVLNGKYYVYQKGNVFMISDRKTLKLIKQLLIKIARERKQYLIQKYDGESLTVYGLSLEYVLNLDKKVNELTVKA